MDLAEINAVADLTEKEILKIDSMVRGELYPVQAIRPVSTKFSRRIILELATGIVFMPSRFSKISDDVLNNVNENSEKFAIVYRGKQACGKTNNAKLVEFVDTDKQL